MYVYLRFRFSGFEGLRSTVIQGLGFRIKGFGNGVGQGFYGEAVFIRALRCEVMRMLQGYTGKLLFRV